VKKVLVSNIQRENVYKTAGHIPVGHFFDFSVISVVTVIRGDNRIHRHHVTAEVGAIHELPSNG